MSIDLVDRLIKPTAAYINDKIQGYVATAETTLTAWAVGDPNEQILQAVSFTIEAFAGIVTALTRGGFGETAEDPGDDPNDPDPDYTAPKWLSYWGEGLHGTVRLTKTFATGSVTMTNDPTGQTRTFKPFELTFTRSTLASDGTQPTYQNEVDATLYVGPDGTIQLAPGGEITIPIVADVIGTGSNANPGEISILTTTMLGVTVTNAASVRAIDGESKPAYVARCRKAASATSPGGPADAVEYLATTLPGGDPLLNASGSPVNITRTYVSKDSATGNVDAYYASPAGAADSADVTAANANIIKYGVADTVTFGPSNSPIGGVSATPVSIAITYTAKIKNASGLVAADIEDEIEAALVAYFPTVDVGGVDQVAGAGVIYSEDLKGVIYGAHVGLYGVALTIPAGSSTPILLGEVAVPGAISGVVTLV